MLRTRKMQHGPDKPFTFAKNMVVVIQPNLITEDEQKRKLELVVSVAEKVWGTAA